MSIVAVKQLESNLSSERSTQLITIHNQDVSRDITYQARPLSNVAWECG